jgi:hypothetical protein
MKILNVIKQLSRSSPIGNLKELKFVLMTQLEKKFDSTFDLILLTTIIRKIQR